MSEQIKAGKNIQRHSYQITINNPVDYGFNHDEIKKTLLTNFTTIKYFCMADEIGEQGTYHTHIYVVFSSRVRWSKIKKHFEKAHIEVAYATAESNRDYVKKTGRWEDSEKAETKVDGTYEEWGNFPKQKGQRPEMEELFELVKSGYSNTEILAINNDYILNIDKIDKLRTMLLIEKYKDERRTDLKVIYISGPTGTGKTRGVLDKHKNSNVYRVTDYQHSFDGYTTEAVLCFDEFRSQIRLSDMLNYMDIYPIQLPARYANKFACYNVVYIISNWSLEEQYREVQHDNPESWQAFLRRIHEVHIYNADGSIDTYDSVKKYMNRNFEFHSPTTEEKNEIPFTQEELPFKED